MSGLVAAAGARLAFGRAEELLAGIPRRAWIALALLICLALATCAHQRHAAATIAAAKEAAREAATAAADARWQGAFARMDEAARQWRANYEAAAAARSASERKLQDAHLRLIAARADDLRMRGPGAAAAPACAGSGDGAAAAAAAGRPLAAAAGADAPLAGMPADEALALVPWDELVTRGAGADADRDEVARWRAWYSAEAALLAQARAALEAQAAQGRAGE